MQYAPVIRPGRLPAVDVTSEADIAEADRPAEAARFAAAATAVANRRVAGSNASDSTEIYQEGLRIPLVKMYERGQRNETLFAFIEKNVRMPAKVQYAWQHPSRRQLYVTTSNGGPRVPSDQNHVSAWRIAADGGLLPLGQPRPLARRAVHMCVDPTGRFTLNGHNFGGGGLTVFESGFHGWAGELFGVVGLSMRKAKRDDGKAARRRRGRRSWPWGKAVCRR